VAIAAQGQFAQAMMIAIGIRAALVVIAMTITEMTIMEVIALSRVRNRALRINRRATILRISRLTIRLRCTILHHRLTTRAASC
jgi:hypothetical protein